MGYFFTFLYLFIIYLILTILKKLFNLSGDITRKIMHIFSCLSVFIINYFYLNSIHMFIIPFIYIWLNYIIIKFNLFSIMKRNTKHYGAIYFSITLFIGQLFVYFDNNLLELSYYALLILAFGDGASGLFGATLKHNFKLTKYKTLVGFISFVICAFLSLIVVDKSLLCIGYMNILIVVITSAVVELLTESGLDNFSIYFISLFILKLMIL